MTQRDANAGFCSRAFRMLRSITTDLIQYVSTGLKGVYFQGENWMLDAKRASYGLAVARILLGIMILGFTMTNFSTRLYTFGAGAAWTGELQYPSSDFAVMWPFSIFSEASTSAGWFTLLYILLMLIALCFTVGYRTKLMMIPLFVLWVGLTQINTYVNDQSDNLTRISFIAMFLASPSERWSVDAWRRNRNSASEGGPIVRLWHFQPVLPAWFTNLVHNCAIIILAVQLCFVYASGGLYKAQGLPWFGGTAVYDPIHTAQFGTWPELSAIATAWGPAVAIATIGTVLVQTTFPLLLMRRGTRIFALAVIFAFHVAIGVLMGLPWFSLAMLALDSIFIRDRTWAAIGRRVAKAWPRAGDRSLTAQEPPPLDPQAEDLPVGARSSLTPNAV